MTFHPRMQSRIEGITVVEDLRWRAWAGMIADVWSLECTEGASGEYLSPHPRLFVVLDSRGEGGVALEAEGGAAGNALQAWSERPLSFMPAGLRIRSAIRGVTRLTHLDLHFDLPVLLSRFDGAVDPTQLDAPRLGFADDRVMRLARLIAAECVDGDRDSLHDLYGESLVLALFAALLEAAPAARKRARGRLADRQLRRATDFLQENCLRNVRLEELAALTGLSQSHFCHAFKASTGMPPHQWQMQARIARVKELLSCRGVALTAVAATAGFSDQAHLTRVFRRWTGTTPAAWRREQAVPIHPFHRDPAAS